MKFQSNVGNQTFSNSFHKGKSQAAGAKKKREFVFYFLEQVGALLGTWLQQVVLGWLMHSAPTSLNALGYISPQLSSILMVVCSAATWLLLTVWNFKIRERFRHITRLVNILKSEISTARRQSLLNWSREERCCFINQTACRG